MCLLRSKKWRRERTRVQKAESKGKRKKRYKDYLIEDPSVRHEAHSFWEAEDIYDEDDFNN